jgi:hypothetical protein
VDLGRLFLLSKAWEMVRENRELFGQGEGRGREREEREILMMATKVWSTRKQSW